MKSLTLIHRENSTPHIYSPAVGYFKALAPSGSLVESNQIVGHLQVLNQTLALRMPEGPCGRVEWAQTTPCHEPVSYGHPLGTWSPASLQGNSEENSEQVAEQGSPYKAPMEGLFYCRPDPDSDAFVTEGQVLKPGDQVGLIEVMKTFYPIFFEGTKPQTVKSIKVKDAQAVEMGTTLLVLIG